MKKIFLTPLFLVTFAAAAPILVSTSTYSLTFPDGWQQFSIPGRPLSDTSRTIMFPATGAIATTYGIPTDHPSTPAEIAAALAVAGAGRSTQTASGTVQAGTNTFAIAEWKDTTATNADARTRVYITTKGNFLFETLLIYDVVKSPGAVASVESALATLVITATTSIQPRVEGETGVLPRNGKLEALHDVLGRHKSLQTPGLKSGALLFSR